jgi:hypothetical protein
MIYLKRNKGLKRIIAVIIIVVFLFHYFPSPVSNSNKSEAAIAAAPILIAAGIGAAKGALLYVATCFIWQREFNLYDLEASMVIGACEGMAVLLINVFGPAWLAAVFNNVFSGPSEVTVDLLISEVLQKPVSDALKFVHELEASARMITFNFIFNLILSHSQDIERKLNPIMDKINNASSYTPETNDIIQINADFSNEDFVAKNIDIRTNGVGYHEKSWRMLTPGQSYLEGTFNLTSVPSGVMLDLIHLTSYAAGVPGDGYSPIDITINGNLFLDNYDVAQNHNGSHGFEKDSWQISDYLNTGQNTIRIELEDNPWAYTHYWINTLSIYTGQKEVNRYIQVSSIYLNKSIYKKGETATLTVECKDQTGNLLNGASVSCLIKDDSSILKTLNCSGVGNGKYRATFNTRDLGRTGNFTVDVIAKMGKYSQGIGSTKFSVEGEPGELSVEPMQINFSLSQNSSTSKSITLKNTGEESISVIVSKSGSISSWISGYENSFVINGGGTKILNFNITIPSNANVGSVYSGNLTFSSNNKNTSTLINVFVTDFSAGEHYFVISSSGEVDGFTNYPGTCTTKYSKTNIYINDSDGSEKARLTDSFSLSIDEYDRLALLYVELKYTKIKDITGFHQIYLNYNGETQWKSLSMDVGETRTMTDYLSLDTKSGTNNLIIGLWSFVHNANKTEWRLDKVAFLEYLNNKVWKGHLNISQEDLNKIKAGWSSGYIEAKVNSVGKEGPLYLYVNGIYSSSVGVGKSDVGRTVKLYIDEKSKQLLSTSNTFHIKGSGQTSDNVFHYNDTKVTFGEIGCRLKFYAGEPNIKVTKSVSPSEIMQSQTATVTITQENIGTNVAWHACYEDTLPEVFELVSGSLNRCCSLNPEKSCTYSYQIKATATGEFPLPAVQVTYNDPSGNSYQSTSNSPVIIVLPPPPPKLALTGEIDKNEYFEGEKISLKAILKDENGSVIEGGSVTYSVIQNDTEKMNGVMINTSNGFYSTDFNAPIYPGNYKIKIIGNKEGYDTDTKELFFRVKDTSIPSITLLSPNGVEIWKIGDTYDILWNANDNVEVSKIKIEYSTNGGTNFSLISDSYSNSGSYPWKIPNEPSSYCKIRITAFDNAGNTASDLSDESFTISSVVTGYINVVISPQEAIDAGAQWKLTDETIWHNSGELVSYIYGDYILEFKDISGWIKPNDKPIKITLGVTVNESGTYRKSVSVTTMPVSLITSSSAVCGGNVTSEVSTTITAIGVCWSEFPNPTIADCIDKTIDGSGIGSFTSHITGLVPSTTYHVRAYATTDEETFYGSDIEFTTTSSSYDGQILIIDLDRNQNSASEIQNAIEANGFRTEYTTSIPSEINSQIFPVTFVCLGVFPYNHVLSTGEGEVLENYLNKSGCLYMEGSDTWAYDTHTSVHPYFGIKSVSDGLADTAYVTGISGTFNQGFSFGYEGDNKYMDRINVADGVTDAYVIWENQTPAYYNGVARDAIYYRTIGVSFEFGGIPLHLQNEIIRKYLNFLTTNQPVVIKVTSPNGGENLTLGDIHNITWESSNLSGTLIITLWKDGTIVGLIAGDIDHSSNSYSWTVGEYTVGTASAGSGYTVKIEETGTIISDSSDTSFTISESQTSSITVISPNGGEKLEAGSVQTIIWTSTGIVENVKIEYSTNNGSSWSTITSYTANDGSYSWTVPNVFSSQCLIKISEVSGGFPYDTSDAVFSISAPTPPQISLSRAELHFGATTSLIKTSSQSILIANIGGGILNWSITYDKAWISCTPLSSSGSAIVMVEVNPVGLSTGTYIGNITVTDPNATNSPQTITVTLMVYNSWATEIPFGEFATPVQGSTVRSSIPVTGWVLDDIGVESVKIYRKEAGTLIYIGYARFVEGARPDVELSYPGYPMNYRAGWGYMMLTNFLPNGGNGTFNIHAIATDTEGYEVTLGIKTIICDNANAVKPFGAIDTPTQGGTASGSSFVNWGWALTPQPNSIPTDGSTINVIVDGVNLGHPTYNMYRSDIADLFPDYTNSSGAAGNFYLNTTTYENGVHTIAWTAVDDAGNTDGIGSRYFSIQNLAERTAHSSERVAVFNVNPDRIPVDYLHPVKIKKGCHPNVEPVTVYPNEKGIITIEIKELERVEIHFLDSTVNIELRTLNLSPLPIGSTLDSERGIFYWQPGPGFIGEYRFVFILSEKEKTGMMSKKDIIIKIIPKFRK